MSISRRDQESQTEAGALEIRGCDDHEGVQQLIVAFQKGIEKQLMTKWQDSLHVHDTKIRIIYFINSYIFFSGLFRPFLLPDVLHAR